MKIYHKMYILELNVETWNIKKLIKMPPFHILFKMTLTYQPCFLHYSFIFKQLYKMTLFKAVYTSGKKKTGALCLGRL
jgi:hypothetical protein